MLEPPMVVLRASLPVRTYLVVMLLAFVVAAAVTAGRPHQPAGPVVLFVILVGILAVFVYRVMRFAVLGFADGTLILRGYLGTRVLRRSDITSFRSTLQLWPILAPVIEVNLRDGRSHGIYLPGPGLIGRGAEIPLKQLREWLHGNP